MPARTAPHGSWYHSNRYSADSACEHCGGVVRHETWCISGNSRVHEAYQAVLDPSALSLQDELILHALGVTWNGACQGKCKG
jgi:hypothetical protein